MATSKKTQQFQSAGRNCKFLVIAQLMFFCVIQFNHRKSTVILNFNKSKNNKFFQQIINSKFYHCDC